MTFHSLDEDGKTALVDFGTFDKPDEIPFFIPPSDVVTEEDMAVINLAATIESIGTVENDINTTIDALEDVASVFDMLGIPQGEDSERYW